jgi:HlyD family secretion protein
MTDADKTQSGQLPRVDNGLAKSSQQKPTKKAGFSRFRLIPLIMLSAFAGAVMGLYFQPPALKAFFWATGLQPGAGTDTPIAVATEQVRTQQEVAVVSEGDIVALGRILPQGDVISIATPFGAGDARIAEILVGIGDTVKTNDVLATLDNKAQLQSAVDAAHASVAVREATLVQTRESISVGRAEASAALERSQATAQEAQAELARATSLFERSVMTRAEFDRVVTRATEAERDVARNMATLSRFDPLSGSAQADIAVAQANLDAAKVEVVRAERNLSQAQVSAPIDGSILSVNARVGERPGAGGILNMGDTAQMTVEAEVYQTLIGRVEIGDKVSITADALDGELTGHVKAIGLEIGRQSITSDDPAANTDARVVDVIIWLDETASEKAARFTNLEVLVRIHTRPDA